jgi:hypothetical protein
VKRHAPQKRKGHVFAELTEGMAALAESGEGGRTLKTHAVKLKPDRTVTARRKPASSKPQPSALANIEFLIDGNGDITIGRVGSIRCVATAADEDQCLAMLVRRPGEALADLLHRLDAALGEAYENGVVVDEVNTPPGSCLFVKFVDDAG